MKQLVFHTKNQLQTPQYNTLSRVGSVSLAGCKVRETKPLPANRDPQLVLIVLCYTSFINSHYLIFTYEIKTTFGNGSLGSCNDEERSEMR